MGEEGGRGVEGLSVRTQLEKEQDITQISIQRRIITAGVSPDRAQLDTDKQRLFNSYLTPV